MQNEKTLSPEGSAELLQGEQTGENTADAGQESQKPEGASRGKKSWEEILADPEYRSEYDRQVQSIVKKRLRDRQANEEKLKKLTEAMEAIGRSLGMEKQPDSELDAAQLAEKVRRASQDKLKGEYGRAAQAKARLDSLKQQAELMKKNFPDFDLARELENREFLKLTAPHTGLSLEEAYYALHYRELAESLTKAVSLSAARSVGSGAARPRELKGGQAALSSSGDPRQMSRQEREELKKRIYQASAQGKKLPYGS